MEVFTSWCLRMLHLRCMGCMKVRGKKGYSMRMVTETVQVLDLYETTWMQAGHSGELLYPHIWEGEDCCKFNTNLGHNKTLSQKPSRHTYEYTSKRCHKGQPRLLLNDKVINHSWEHSNLEGWGRRIKNLKLEWGHRVTLSQKATKTKQATVFQEPNILSRVF